MPLLHILRRLLLLLAWLAVVCLAPSLAFAQGTWREPFDSAEVSWRAAGGDVPYRADSHLRTQQGARAGGCEYLRITGDNGSSAYIGHVVGEPRVISELGISLWLRADRPGLQLLAHVVLPRSINPATGKPASVVVAGDSYKQVGVWQRLTLGSIAQLVERQARVLRTTLGSAVDAREAYVDGVMLNIYGGPGTTSVWIDDLEMTGVVARDAADPQAASTPAATRPATNTLERLPATWEASRDTGGGAAPSVRLQGNVLLVGDRPFFPRIIPYHGEPLDRLKQLGFNTVKVASLPGMELLEEATRHGMWLIAKPPTASELTTRNEQGRLTTIGSDFDRVLCWDLGGDLSTAELDVVRPWVKALRSADPRSRPIMCQPTADWRSYSRVADIIVAERSPLGSSEELNEYGIWLRSRGQLARPGTPLWTVIHTEPAKALVAQMALFNDGQAPRLNWQHEQLRAIVVTALAAGVRGICFDSQSPLDATDADSAQRALLIEWLNRELELIAPWVAGGSFATTADCTDPNLVGVVLATDRARLLLPLAIARHNQFAIEHGAAGAVSFTVPGASESNDAYELSAAGMRPLSRRRVAGGLRLTLSDADRTSPIVMTQDPLVISTLSRRALEMSPRLFELERSVGAHNLAVAVDVDRRLRALGRALPNNDALMKQAREQLDRSERVAATNDLPQAEQNLRASRLSLRQMERSQWREATNVFSSPLASPFAINFQTLPEHWQLVGRLASARRGMNRMATGDCESLETMLAAGWKHLDHPQPNLTTGIDLVADNPHSGKYCVRMSVSAASPQTRPDLVETSPLWLTTAPVYVESGEWLQINGFVRVPTRIHGSVDGLMIFDSLTGDALAERIHSTHDWQEFTLYRAAPESGNLSITFALSGVGEAWIDDVTIQAIERSASPGPQAMRLPELRR